jgi:hypothetical protein
MQSCWLWQLCLIQVWCPDLRWAEGCVAWVVGRMGCTSWVWQWCIKVSLSLKLQLKVAMGYARIHINQVVPLSTRMSRYNGHVPAVTIWVLSLSIGSKIIWCGSLIAVGALNLVSYIFLRGGFKTMV